VAGLTGLSVVYLNNNQITSIEALKNWNNTQLLDTSNNPIKDNTPTDASPDVAE